MANLIEPSSFDLIVLDTGLPQCIIAAAAAFNGHSVLHVDPCDFYGSHWTSLSLKDFQSWSTSSGQLPIPCIPQIPPEPQGQLSVESVAGGISSDLVSKFDANVEIRSESVDTSKSVLNDSPENLMSGESLVQNVQEKVEAIDKEAKESLANKDLEKQDRRTTINKKEDDAGINSGNQQETINNDKVMADMGLEAISLDGVSSLYSHFHTLANVSGDLGRSRSYSIDLSGPKLLFGGGPLVELLIKSGASQYLEFKGLEGSFIWSPEGLSLVPSSRADVFKDRSLGNAEKRYLMRFFKLVVDFASSGPQSSGISEEDLEIQFVDFLQRQHLPSSVQSIILYAITFASHKQQSNNEDSNSLIKTKDGLKSLALYLTSVGRFPNANGAFLYPLYGQGELPQAFSRCAAVKGALHVLRMPVDSILRDKETCEFRGLRMSTGQLIFSKKFVTGPAVYPSLLKAFPCEEHVNRSCGIEKHLKVVRAVCITNMSLKPDLTTLMVVFPPESLPTKNASSIRALQLGSGASVCPDGKFLVQLCMICYDESDGMDALQAAANALFHNPGFSSENKLELDRDKPTLLWATFYEQCSPFTESFNWISAKHVVACGMPDETIDYRNVVDSAEKIFQELFPEEEFFPKVASIETDDVGTDDGPLDGIDSANDTEACGDIAEADKQ